MNGVRALARSWRYQTLFSSGNKINATLFINNGNYTKLQIAFLQWLGIYENLYEELSSPTNDGHLTEHVIKDEYRTDAYLVWRKKENERRAKEQEFKKKYVHSSHKPLDSSKEFVFDLIKVPRSKK
jgi:hypothetical protein